MSYDEAATDPHHGGKLDFEDWKDHVANILARAYGVTVDAMFAYVTNSSDAWRESYDDGLTPGEAADEDIYAANS